MDNIFVLVRIQPTELGRTKPMRFLTRRAQKPEHLLHNRLASSSFVHLRQLKLRHQFVPEALKLLNNLGQPSTSVAQWADYNGT